MTSISLKRVNVDFPIYGGTSRSLKNMVLHATSGGLLGRDAMHRTMVSALREISIDLFQGSRIGLVGGNGAGKTTLLRVMANIYEPTAGSVATTGRVVPLFGGTLGMDLDLPGYDNILMRGVMLGLSRREIAKKAAEIAAFTGLEDFLYLPVRTYSAGMRVRLAFAISTSVNADILLLDEGVGAGDATFMDRATHRLQEFVRRAGILVLATHSISLMRSLCDRVLWLHRGEMRMFGPIEDVLAEYRLWILAERERQGDGAKIAIEET
jgi:ABC-2 type transport system ATP-binding protein